MQVGLTREEVLALIAGKAQALAVSIHVGIPVTDSDIDVAVSRLSALTATLFEPPPQIPMIQKTSTPAKRKGRATVRN